jgi:hypothetical protein
MKYIYAGQRSLNVRNEGDFWSYNLDGVLSIYGIIIIIIIIITQPEKLIFILYPGITSCLSENWYSEGVSWNPEFS